MAESPDKQRARREAEQLRLLVHGTTEYAIFMLDPEGHVVTWNSGAERLKGYKAEEIIGQHFSRFYPPDAIERDWPQHELEVARREGRFEDEGWRVRKDGTQFWANVVITALFDEAGNFLGFSKITRDLTERKRSEENARRLAEESAARRVAEGDARLIQEQQEWLRVTLASIGDAVIATDRQGRVTFLNGVAQELTGWTQEDAQGRPLEAVFAILNEQTRQPVENPVEKVLRDGAIVGLGNHTVLIARDGTERPVDDSAAPIRDAAGKLIGVVLTFRDVTEQRRTAREVRQSEARKSAILETALDCIITMDHEGKVVEFNPAAEKTFGYSRGQIIGQELVQFIIPPSLRDRHYKGMAHYLATGEGPVLGKRLELPALRADGTEFPVELAITRISTDGPPLFTAYLRDITERVRAEQHRNLRLAVTQALSEAVSVDDGGSGVLRSVCENLGWDVGFFWLVGEKGDSLVCRASWHKQGVTVTEFEAASRGRTFAKGEGLPGRVWERGKPAWILDVSQDTNFPRLASAAKYDLHSAFACPIVVGDQTLGVIEFFTQRIREADADLLETMGTVAGNIGQFIERKIAEEELRRSEQEARKQEQRTRTILESITDAFCALDRDWRFVYVNREAETLLGRSRDDLIGKSFWDEYPDTLGTDVERNYRCAVGDNVTVRFEHFYPPHDRWYEVHAYPSSEGLSIYFRDVSQRKRAEIALRDTDRRKDEFLATLAHELRNPLAPIRNSLQILKMPRVDAATAQQTREMMERQVHHLVRLVDDLLDVSRVMRGKIELRKEPVELATVVARAVETIQPLIEVQGHELDISLSPESLLLDADPVRLAQVVSNLLTNAAKYTEANGRIGLTAKREGDQALLKVLDNGIGIAADMLPHVFELFVQADHSSTKSHGGLGIGLTLVKNLVEMHGGSVEAHSAGLGKGCEFVVRLPLSIEQSPGPIDGNGQQREAANSGHRLLVVDDNKDAAISLAALLQLQGHEVRIAHDGPAALEQAASYRPDLILLDLGMPGMDGYEVARRIRNTPGLEKTVLTALTGWGQKEDRRRTAEAGFDHHLVKPADPKALENVLAALQSAAD